MTLPLATSQRGVGWTHVVNAPRVIRYLSRPELLDHLAVEIDIRFLVPELPAVGLRAERHQTRGVVKRAGAAGDVVLEPLCGQTSLRRREDDVALSDHAVRIAEQLDLVGEQRRLGAERKLDLPGQNAVVALALGLQ